MNRIAAAGNVARQRPHLCISSELYREQVPRGWHVLWTRSNCERLVHDQLARKGYDVFLPQMRQWTLRKHGDLQAASVPMFRGYLFLRHDVDKHAYIDICKCDGLVAILGARWDRLARVPHGEVDAIKRAIDGQLPTQPWPWMDTGDKVRITHGALADAEGILIKTEPAAGLFILSVNLLRRSVAVEVNCANVVPA